jgi:outer membrane protein TolC
MPLTFDNTQYEAKKARAAHNYSSLNYEISSFKKRYEEETKALKTRLNVYKVHVSATEESIRVSSDKLIRQSNLRFKAGEESLIEILKATETKLQMIDTILQLKLKRHEAVSNYLYNYAIDPQGVKR